MRRIGIGLCIIGLLAWGCGTDRKTYEGDIPPQSGQFYKNKMTDQVVVADCRRDTPIGRMTATALQGLGEPGYSPGVSLSGRSSCPAIERYETEFSGIAGRSTNPESGVEKSFR